MKRIYALIVFLCSFMLFPCITAYAEVNPEAIIAGTTIPETVLVERDGVKITANGLSATTGLYPMVNILITVQNTRDEDIIVFVNDISINAFQLWNLNNVSVPKKSSLDYVINLDTIHFEINKIEHILTAGLSFEVDNSDYDNLFETEELTITTSAYGQYTQQYDHSGTVIYDNKNIKVIVKPQIVEGYNGQNVLLYIENNSIFNIQTEAENITVNRVPVKIWNTTYVKPGKRMTEELTVSWEDLAKNGIMKISNINMNLRISTYDSGYSDAYGTSNIDFSTDLKVSF